MFFLFVLYLATPLCSSYLVSHRQRRRGVYGLRGKTLGIIGLGRVGKQVFRFANAFGMEVFPYDPSKFPYNSSKAAFENVLKNSDIITVHVPFNEETYHMFSEKEFAMMKPTAYFINTSRGAVVDEKELLLALVNNKIAGAAVDVMEAETNTDFLWEQYQNFHKVLATLSCSSNQQCDY